MKKEMRVELFENEESVKSSGWDFNTNEAGHIRDMVSLYMRIKEASSRGTRWYIRTLWTSGDEESIDLPETN